MTKTVAVSFKEESVEIVHASLKGSDISVESAKEIGHDEFENYLRKEKAKKFIVTYNFNESHHDIITTPVVKTGYIKNIVESEIRKKTDLKDFSFMYTPIGVRLIENKRVMEVSYFAVKNEEIRKVAQQFYDNGKTIKALYPGVFSVAALFASGDESVIGVMGTATGKTAFLLRQGIIYFIRKSKSLTKNISATDIKDINMSINFCRQNLKISPSRTLLTGNLSVADNISESTYVPLESLNMPDYIHSSKEIFNEFIIPISSFHASKSSNILNREFKNVNTLKHYLLNASRVFIVVTLFCLGAIFYNVKNSVDIKGMLTSINKNNIDNENTLSEYREKETEFRKYISFIKLLNKPAPDIQKFFITLAGFHMKKSTITSVEGSVKDDFFSVTLNGTIDADTYSSAHKEFQDIIVSLRDVEGVKILDKTMNMGNKTFLIKINYKG